MNPKNLKVVDWKYLTENDTLFHYLNQVDLIELSKTCKRHRKQLEPKIFNVLKLIEKSKFMPNNELYRKLDNAPSIDILGLLEGDLKHKLHLVREVTINIFISNQFSTKFVSLMPNVTKLNLFSKKYRGNLSSLSNILNGLKQLTHIEYLVGKHDTINFDNNDQVFPKSLKSIKANSIQDSRQFLSIFDTIDSSYTNLRSLTIPSNKMLTNLDLTMTSLKDVEIINHWDINEFVLLKFIKKNPHLKKLRCCFKLENNELLNTVLSFNNLTYLDIEGYKDIGAMTCFPVNTSIRRLKLYTWFKIEALMKLINACKGLKVLDFTEWAFNYSDAVDEWSTLNRRFNTIYFNGSQFSTRFLNFIDNFEFFIQASFTYSSSIDNIVNARDYKWNNYIVIRKASLIPITFYLQKIHK